MRLLEQYHTIVALCSVVDDEAAKTRKRIQSKFEVNARQVAISKRSSSECNALQQDPSRYHPPSWLVELFKESFALHQQYRQE